MKKKKYRAKNEIRQNLVQMYKPSVLCTSGATKIYNNTSVEATWKRRRLQNAVVCL